VDPITLIVSAVLTGAVAAVGETASSAVKDLYAGLKSLLKRSVQTEGESSVLDRPDPDRHELEELFKASGVDRDKNVIEAAKLLLYAADPGGAARGKYTISVTGGVVGNVGDGGTAHIGRTD
jgi:hypothetical protein